MKSPWWIWLLILISLPALFLTPVFRGIFEKKEALPVEPICFVSGKVTPPSAPQDSGFGGLSNMIRLKLDARTLVHCKIELEAYCRSILSEQPRSSLNLKAYFRDQRGRRDFVIKENCLIREQTIAN